MALAFDRLVSDTVSIRMRELADLFQSGLSERTGKLTARDREGYAIGGRGKGVKPGTALASFKENPKRLALAIRGGNRRGRNGRLYRSIRKYVKKSVLAQEGDAIQEFVESRPGRAIAAIGEARRRRPLVEPHAAIRHCKFCQITHSFSRHASHGLGSHARRHKPKDNNYPADWDVL